MEQYVRGLDGIKTVTPEKVDTGNLEAQLQDFLSRDRKYAFLSADDKVKQKQHYSDVLTSVTIAGNNQLRDLLLATNNSNFVFIRNSHTTFPQKTEERSYGCSHRGSPPQGYVVSESLLVDTMALTEEYQDITRRLDKASNHLVGYEKTLQQLTATGEQSQTQELVQKVGDMAITLQEDINPDSSYSMLTSGWRTAIPFILLFGLGGLGVGAGYAGVSAFDRRRKRRDFANKYGSY